MNRIATAAIIGMLAISIVSAYAFTGFIRDIPWIAVKADKFQYNTGDVIFLHGTISKGDKATVSIHEQDGTQVESWTEPIVFGLFGTTLTTQNLPAGHYYVEIAEGQYVERINISFT